MLSHLMDSLVSLINVIIARATFNLGLERLSVLKAQLKKF